MSRVEQALSACIAGFCRDSNGVTSLEYGVIAAVTVVVVGGLIATTGTSLTTIFTAVNGAL